jgi:hypothetical protein
MHQHRFREAVEAELPVVPFSGTDLSAFVSFPIGTLVPTEQHAHVVALYRVAAERTREQLARHRPFRLPQFSAN